MVVMLLLQGSAGAYGDYNCNIPLKTLELFLQEAASFQPQFVLYTGTSTLMLTRSNLQGILCIYIYKYIPGQHTYYQSP